MSTTIFGYRTSKPTSPKRTVALDEIAKAGERLGVSRAALALHRRGMLTPEIESVLDEVKERAR